MAQNNKISDQSIKIFNITIFSNTKDSLLNHLREHLESKKSLLTVMTPNPEQVVLSRSNPTFLDHLQSADLNIPDGVGLVFASKLMDISKEKPSLKERISGREVATFLFEYAQENGLSVLVIGGRGYGAGDDDQLAALVHHDAYDKAFWLEGYADVQNPTNEEEAAVEDRLKKIKPNIVFVAFGAPWQEEWVVKHHQLLESSGVRIAMVVGGAFDVLLGKIPQAPAWMDTLGLEWLYRLIQEPWRWRRQLKLLEFIKLTIQSM